MWMIIFENLDSHSIQGPLEGTRGARVACFISCIEMQLKLRFYSLFTRYVFTIVSYLIGVFIFATIVGQVGNVITNRNANRLEFERLLDGAKTYMRHHKVSVQFREPKISISFSS